MMEQFLLLVSKSERMKNMFIITPEKWKQGKRKTESTRSKQKYLLKKKELRRVQQNKQNNKNEKKN